MAERSSGPFMKMSPSGFPGLLIVLFVVLTSYEFFGDDFLWVLLGFGDPGWSLIGRVSFPPFAEARRRGPITAITRYQEE